MPRVTGARGSVKVSTTPEVRGSTSGESNAPTDCTGEFIDTEPTPRHRAERGAMCVSEGRPKKCSPYTSIRYATEALRPWPPTIRVPDTRSTSPGRGSRCCSTTPTGPLQPGLKSPGDKGKSPTSSHGHQVNVTMHDAPTERLEIGIDDGRSSERPSPRAPGASVPGVDSSCCSSPACRPTSGHRVRHDGPVRKNCWCRRATSILEGGGRIPERNPHSRITSDFHVWFPSSAAAGRAPSRRVPEWRRHGGTERGYGPGGRTEWRRCGGDGGLDAARRARRPAVQLSCRAPAVRRLHPGDRHRQSRLHRRLLRAISRPPLMPPRAASLCQSITPSTRRRCRRRRGACRARYQCKVQVRAASSALPDIRQTATPKPWRDRSRYKARDANRLRASARSPGSELRGRSEQLLRWPLTPPAS